MADACFVCQLMDYCQRRIDVVSYVRMPRDEGVWARKDGLVLLPQDESRHCP